MNRITKFFRLLFKPVWLLFTVVILNAIGLITLFFPDLQPILSWPTLGSLMPWYIWVMIGLMIWLVTVTWNAATQPSQDFNLPKKMDEIPNPCAQKIPPVEDHNWRKKADMLEKKFKQHPQLFIHGINGSGSIPLGRYLLKKVGFPKGVKSDNCHFVSIEFRGYKTFTKALDSIFNSLGAASNTSLGIERKIRIIQRIAQDKDLAILFQDVEVLDEADKEALRSLISQLSERAHVYVTSTIPYPNHWMIEVEELSPLSVNEVLRYAETIASSRGNILDDSFCNQLSELLTVTHGYYEGIKWGLLAENHEDLRVRISELREGGGAIKVIIERFFKDLSESEKKLVQLIANFGGSISRLSLLRSNPFRSIDIDTFIKKLSDNLVVTEYPSGDNYFLRIPPGNIGVLKSLKFELPNNLIEQWANRLIGCYRLLDEIDGQEKVHISFDSDVVLIEQMCEWLINNGLFQKADSFYRATCELLFNRGFFEQRVRYGTKIAQSLEANGHFQSASWVYSSASSVNTLLGQYSDALEGLQKGKELAVTHNFPVEKARALRAIAGLHYRKGELDVVEEEISRLMNSPDIDLDKFNKVDALYVKAGLEIFNRQYSEAAKSLLEMQNLSSEIGWKRGRAYADLELAILSAVEGDLEEAKSQARFALEVAKEYKDRRQTARCELAIGKIEIAQSGRSPFPKKYNRFYRALDLIAKAQREFNSLRMDNEFDEAKRVLDRTKETRIGQSIPFKTYYGVLPIGGD